MQVQVLTTTQIDEDVFKVIEELSGYIDFLLINVFDLRSSFRFVQLYSYVLILADLPTLHWLECHNHAGGADPRGEKLKKYLIQQSQRVTLFL